YGSVHRMHELSPTFAQLQKKIDAHVRKYVRALELDMEGRELAMTDCWVNIMPRQVVHSLHLHPLSTISGTYYVQTPKLSSGLKFEDPRLDKFMAAPPKRPDARLEHRPWFVVPAQTGNVVLFESWLRHEVPPNPVDAERISISFNYNWF
ncbi:MAG TPA: TIGR02466 family protein, partial [Steroidobacteraceae bacterium]